MQRLVWSFSVGYLINCNLCCARRDATGDNLVRLQQIIDEVDCLSDLLLHYAQVPLISLQAVRQQLARVASRLEKEFSPGQLLVQSAPARAYMATTATKIGSAKHNQSPEVIVVTVTPEPPPASARLKPKRSAWPWLLFAGISACALVVGGWRWLQATDQQKIPAPIQLDGLLLFPPGSAELRPEATKVLMNGLMHIKAQPNWLVVVSGHSDSSGDGAKNLEISKARATAVKDWMQQMGGIPDSCFLVQSYEASEPIMSNNSEARRTANRRVEVLLLSHEGACDSLARP